MLESRVHASSFWKYLQLALVVLEGQRTHPFQESPGEKKHSRSTLQSFYMAFRIGVPNSLNIWGQVPLLALNFQGFTTFKLFMEIVLGKTCVSIGPVKLFSARILGVRSAISNSSRNLLPESVFY